MTKREHALDAIARGLRVELRDSKGDLAGTATLDPCDATLASRRWSLRPDGYAVRMVGGRIVRMHRAVAGLRHGDPRVVDHINGDPLDNRRANLRVCTRAENAQNRHGRPMRGAHWHAASGRWRARVKLNYIEHHLGLYDTQVAAAEAAAVFRGGHMPYSSEALLCR